MMRFDKTKQEEFERATSKLIKFLNDNCHPHVSVIVTPTGAELLEGFCSFITEEYIHD